MSLHDVDPHSFDRSSPMPNHKDQLANGSVKSHQTLSTTYVANNATTHTRIRFLNNVILYYDDQNRVIRVDGFIPALAAYPVTIIAKYGYDVYVDVLGIAAP
jgi:hypothetical protein